MSKKTRLKYELTLLYDAIDEKAKILQNLPQTTKAFEFILKKKYYTVHSWFSDTFGLSENCH